MRRSTAAGILALIALGGATFLVTSAVTARVKPRRAASASPRMEVRSVEGPRREGDRVSGIRGGKLYAVHAVKNLEVGPIEGGARVSARAYILENRPGVRYAWYVRVHDWAGFDSARAENPRFEKVYDNQLFSMKVGEPAEPTFEDTIPIPLPPGRYVVEAGVMSFLPRAAEYGPRTDRAFSTRPITIGP